MAIQSLLYKKSVPINDSIQIMIPTVGDVIDHEDEYYSLVFSITASPMDMMVQLDDIGVDFTSIDEYDLFLLLFSGMQQQDTSMIFGDLDLSKFELAISGQNNGVMLVDKEHDIRIDRAIHDKIAGALRAIHHLEKNVKKPANKEAQSFLLERARAKLRRERNKKKDSQIEQLIIAMVNTEQYKYDFESTRSLSIFQFNESVRQIIKKIDYDNRMHGIYAGTISAKDLSQDDLNWLSHK